MKPHSFHLANTKELHQKIYGAVSINIPVPYPQMMTAILILFILFCIYVWKADFSEQHIVKGYLNAKSGIARVYPTYLGSISKRYVSAGQFVQKGEPLFLINTIKNATTKPEEYHLLQKKLLTLNQDHKKKSAHLQQLQPLLKKHYVSMTTIEAVQDQLRELQTKQIEVKLALEHYQHDRAYLISAPTSGVISSLEFQEGQMVNLNKPLLTIMPKNAELVAQIYIPVSQAGFLKKKSEISLRYDAYPYQHFGVAKAHIVSMTQSSLNDQDEDKPIKIGESYYKALAILEDPFLLLFEKKYALHQGMTFSAVLPGARKKIWRWAFDPAYRYLKG